MYHFRCGSREIGWLRLVCLYDDYHGGLDQIHTCPQETTYMEAVTGATKIAQTRRRLCNNPAAKPCQPIDDLSQESDSTYICGVPLKYVFSVQVLGGVRAL